MPAPAFFLRLSNFSIRPYVRSCVLVLALVANGVLATQLYAQGDGDKRPLTIADYQLWRTISGSRISADGRWAAWTYTRERSDNVVHIKSLDSTSEHVLSPATGVQLSDDGQWAAYFVDLPFSEAEKLRRDGEDVLREAELINLASGEKLTWGDVTSFEFSSGSSHFFVKKRQANEDSDHDGTDLILRNLEEGYEELIGSVDEAEFNEVGTLFAYSVDAENRDGNGLYYVNLDTGSRRVLDNAKQRYTRLTWSEDGLGIAVLRGETPEEKTERANTLIAFVEMDGVSPQRHVFDPSDHQGLREGNVISEKDGLSWSEDLGRIFVGTKVQQDDLEDWPEEGLPLADVNIWHWADDRIQAAQQRQASQDQDRTYIAVVHLEDQRLVHLADESIRSIEITRNGRWGIGQDETDYVSDWKPDLADYYRVDTDTGDRVQFLEGHLRTLGLSPNGEHFLYWKDGDVWDYVIGANQHRNLTASAPVEFTNKEYDRFGEKPPYGLAGWSDDGESVLLYGRYDLWLQPLDGGTAGVLTGGRGAADEIRFRYVSEASDEQSIDLSEPLLLRAYGEWTKKEGFFRLDGEDLAELTWEDKKFSIPQKAEDANRYLFTVQSWEDFPDLWMSAGDFDVRERVSDANPQNAEFKWGRRILFDYTNSDGVPLQGTLAIPDDYQEGQRLPMIVRFYEKYSQNLHVHPTPAYRHQPNFADYVSNGYLLMQPDVHFRIGSSHSDMLECVEAAVRKVIELGYADPEAVGLSGHSYSGGGGAYIATRSEMFSAVAHGAAPINLVSEFNQLFVGSGQNNHSYDIYGQGRYATNPYDDFDLYWDQSPISGVETMNTPVLYLHGEEDPTVNWEQGLEWYNALRFLEKPVIWLSYPDEGHGLRKLENRIDFQYRLSQFFGHHLKGEPAPDWMTDGVRNIDKERHLRSTAPRIFGRRLIG